jgi:hypothetical protein
MTDIICFMGGACGDIVVASLDPTDTQINGNRISMPLHRQLLKKPHLYRTSEDKDVYLDFIGRHYRSVPSHNTEYHIEQKHNFYSITVDDMSVAQWAAQRFKDLHQPKVWDEMTRVINCNSVEDYANFLKNYSGVVKGKANIIRLEDIIGGNLANYIEVDQNGKDMYYNWLNTQSI